MREKTRSFIAGMLVMLRIVSLRVTKLTAHRKNAASEYAGIKISLG